MRHYKSKKNQLFAYICLVGMVILLLSSCGGNDEKPSQLNDQELHEYVSSKISSIEMPQAGGTPFLQNEFISIDCSNASSGYFTADCSNLGDKKYKIMTQKDDRVYYYDLHQNLEMLVFPFQMDSGTYTINIIEQVEGTKYALVIGDSIDVTLANSFAPFLLPNEYIDYDLNSKAVQKAILLSKDAKTDLATVEEIFLYITQNVKYDKEKAAQIVLGDVSRYMPNIDETLATNKGICFDYASLMAAMLRANGIPTKLVMGYAEPGHIYHAWNLVYITDVGWVAKEIEFDGKNWALIDSTFAVSNSTDGVSYFAVNEY